MFDTLSFSEWEEAADGAFALGPLPPFPEAVLEGAAAVLGEGEGGTMPGAAVATEGVAGRTPRGKAVARARRGGVEDRCAE